MVGTDKTDQKSFGNTWPILFLFLTGLTGILWLRFGSKPIGQQINGEKSAFAELQKACKNNQASQAHSAVHNWIASCAVKNKLSSRPATLAEFSQMLNDENLATELKQLQETLVSPDGNWRGDKLLIALQSARRKINHQRIDASTNYLTPLNP